MQIVLSKWLLIVDSHGHRQRDMLRRNGIGNMLKIGYLKIQSESVKYNRPNYILNEARDPLYFLFIFYFLIGG